MKPIGTFFLNFILTNYSDVLKSRSVVFTNSEVTGWWHDNLIASICKENNILVIDTSSKEKSLYSLKQFVDHNEELRVLSVQFPWIIQENILSALKYPALNLHLSDISKYRGWNSFSHALLNREKTYFWNLHEMNAKVDTGKVLLKGFVQVHPHDTAKSLYSRTIDSVTSNADVILNLFLSHSRSENILFPSEATSRFYDQNSLNHLRNLKLDDFSEDDLFVISRALYFPPYPSPFLNDGGELIPLLPKPMPSCSCESCEELRLRL